MGGKKPRPRTQAVWQAITHSPSHVPNHPSMELGRADDPSHKRREVTGAHVQQCDDVHCSGLEIQLQLDIWGKKRCPWKRPARLSIKVKKRGLGDL